MLYKGQSIWDTRRDFGKNRGQSLAFSNGARDKNTLPCQGTQAKFFEKYGTAMLLEIFCNEQTEFPEKIRDALKSSKKIRDK